jgi:hypothetical protein
MRRPVQDGQRTRPLHENDITFAAGLAIHADYAVREDSAALVVVEFLDHESRIAKAGCTASGSIGEALARCDVARWLPADGVGSLDLAPCERRALHSRTLMDAHMSKNETSYPSRMRCHGVIFFATGQTVLKPPSLIEIEAG